MTVTLIRGDARNLALADASVDLIVTSPPYFALRSYTDGGEHYSGQIGSEATPAEFVAALVECTREWMRVLKPTGSLWLNLGDSYYSGKGAPGRTTVDGKSEARTIRRAGGNPLDGPSFGIGRKSLIGLPWRYALACIDELGLILRAEVIWNKPNGLPESVTDRVRRSHEQWFHFVQQPRYFSAVDEIREIYADARPLNGMSWAQRRARGDDVRQGEQTGTFGANGMSGNPLGKLPGSVWEIASQPLTVPKELGIDHFAAFPMEFPRRIILGWSPSGICVECGEGLRPVVVKSTTHAPRPSNLTALTGAHGADGREGARPSSIATLTGYTCACPEPTAATRPAVVLDPFGGTGTTALVASVLGRRGISVEMSADYCRLAQWRTTDPKQIERAKRGAKVKPPKPEPQPQTAEEWLAYFGR